MLQRVQAAAPRRAEANRPGACYRGDAHVELAAVIEFIHTATLCMTTSLRIRLRPRPFDGQLDVGNAASVLVGDFLYSARFK